MSEVTVAPCTANLGAAVAQRVVVDESDGVGIDGFVKRRPPAVALKLGTCLEQLRTATTAGVKAVTPLVEKFTGARSFCPRFTQNVELLGSERCAPLGFCSLARFLCHAHH